MIFTALDLLEFNVNVMTENNGAHQRTSYDPRIQISEKTFLFCPDPRIFFTSKLMISSHDIA